MQVLLLLFCSVVLGSLSDFDRAEELLRTNPREAEALFSTLILADPKDFVPVMGQGYARYMQKKYYDCQTSFQRATDLLKNDFERKPVLAQAWGMLAKCQEAVQDAGACATSAQESLMVEPSSFEIRFLHAKCQLQRGDMEQFVKSMCAPNGFALLQGSKNFDVFNLLLLGWASVTTNLGQANEFGVKCDSECNEGDRHAYQQIRSHVLDPVEHPISHLEANRKLIGKAKGAEYDRLFRKNCVTFLKKSEQKEEL